MGVIRSEDETCPAFKIRQDLVVALWRCVGADPIFMDGDDNDWTLDLSSGQIFVSPGEFRPLVTSEPPQSNRERQLLAVLRTVESGDVDGFLFLSSQEPPDGAPLVMAYLELEDETRWQSLTDCAVLRTGALAGFIDQGIFHNCDTSEGSGGTPLITPDGTVVGVHSMVFNPDGSRVAVRVDQIVPDIVVNFGPLPTR